MTDPKANIRVPADLTNPGQFFACCGLLELADRLWPGAEAWFEVEHFCIAGGGDMSLHELLKSMLASAVSNTMSAAQNARLGELSGMSKKERQNAAGLEDEKKALESLRREEPIRFTGKVTLQIDWFRDDDAGGSRFKTWAGQQSVLDIASNMHAGIRDAGIESESTLWNSARKIGLPFNLDSELGGQGSALDIGFSFDPLAGSDLTRIEGTCKPALEFLGFLGLQRFRPREIRGQNRFVFTAWRRPLPPSVAAAVACRAVCSGIDSSYEFRLLYRTKYLKSFLPAIPYQGDRDEQD